MAPDPKRENECLKEAKRRWALFAANGRGCLHAALTLFHRERSLVSGVSDQVGAATKHTERRASGARQGGGKRHPLPTPPDVLLSTQLRVRALTFKKTWAPWRKAETPISLLRAERPWKPPQGTCSKPELEPLLSLREFLPRVPDLWRPPFSFLAFSVRSSGGQKGCRQGGLQTMSQAGEAWTPTAVPRVDRESIGSGVKLWDLQEPLETSSATGPQAGTRTNTTPQVISRD